MSNSKAPRLHAAEIDPAAEYYQAVEEYFVSRRGDPLCLSNADWLLIRKWRLAGVPLRIVLRGIRDAFDGHEHSWSRRNKIMSLRYCAAQVEAARRRWYRALAFEPQERARVTDLLDACGRALESAAGLGRRSGNLRARIVTALRGLATEPTEAAALDAWLQKQESSLVRALCADMDSRMRARIEEQIESDLAPYRGRMPEKVIEQVRNESLARRLLEHHGLPRLSVFHAE